MALVCYALHYVHLAREMCIYRRIVINEFERRKLLYCVRMSNAMASEANHAWTKILYTIFILFYCVAALNQVNIGTLNGFTFPNKTKQQ